MRNIMAVFMREYGYSLDDEALRILMCEVEVVVNSRFFTVDILSDLFLLLSFILNIFLIGKSKFIFLFFGKF